MSQGCKPQRHILKLASVSAVLFGASIAKAGNSYTPVDLYTMNPPAGLSYPSGSSSSASGETIGFATLPGGANNNAVLWSALGVASNLNPTNLTGFNASVGLGIGNGQQVGYGSGPATGSDLKNTYNHALLWNGTAGSAVDLHPTSNVGYTNSEAFATNGVNQVGYAIYPSNGGGLNHAMMWSGTAASAVDLQPTQFGPNYFMSVAFAVSGNQQVGYMTGQTGSAVYYNNAILWSGTAASAIDLQPTNLPTQFDEGSVALGIGGGQQVGYGAFSQGNSYTHALLWTGTAASAVDLNPAGASGSEANATNGTWQVGNVAATGTFGPVSHAMVWNGNASSAVDLQSSMGSSIADSNAYAVDSAGDVFGVAGDTSGNYHSIEWVAGAHAATGTIAGGSNQAVTVAGRSPTFGQVDFKFGSATAGTLSNTSSLQTSSALASSTTGLDFAIPTTNGLLQAWDLSFTGTFTGSATLTFHFDPSDLAPGFDPSQLQIEHFVGGQWVGLAGVVDPVADTITVATSSFSPFALGVVPEPSSLIVVMVSAIGVMHRRRK